MQRFLNWPALRDDYARYHTTAGNRVCHIIGIPLIMLAVVRWVGPAAAVVLPLYLVWHPGLGIAMGLVVAGMAAVAPQLPVWAALVLGWIFQLAGHSLYERKSPAFADNLIHILVGPMWILKELLRCK